MIFLLFLVLATWLPAFGEGFTGTMLVKTTKRGKVAQFCTEPYRYQ